MKYVLGIFVAILVLASGYWLSLSQKQEASSIKESVVDIYYLKPDGLYQISSAKVEEERLLSGQFNKLLPASEKLIVSSGSAVMVYDLTSRQNTLIEPVVNTVNMYAPVVSLDGTKVAYVKNIEVAGGFGFHNEIWLLDLNTGEKQKILQEPELGADPEGVYYALNLGLWLSDQELIIGRGYEGISYCRFTLGTDTKLSENCQGFGGQQIGLTDKIFIADGGVGYGVMQTWPEFGLSSSQTGVYRQEGENREFLTDDIASSLVKNGDVLYMAKILNKNNYQPIEADLFSFNLKDESIQRLTHDATSVDTKENLRVSNKGRFLTYDSKEISINASRAWVYDLRLNQYYPIGDNTFSAVVIEH